MEQTVTVRCAEAAELDQLARLWHDAWRDAHEKLAPPEVTRARTLTSFRDRLAALLDDGEARLARRGVRTAWLACAIGNNRAARFYEKRGWVRARTMVNRIDTADGVFE